MTDLRYSTRNLSILEAFIAGCGYTDLATRFHITKQRAQIIVRNQVAYMAREVIDNLTMEELREYYNALATTLESKEEGKNES